MECRVEEITDGGVRGGGRLMDKWKARLEGATERKLTYRDKEGGYADR